MVRRCFWIYIIRYSALKALSYHYEKGLTMLCTYTPKILVKKFNISVDYFQCEKFIVIFFYCHTKIQTCISKKIETKKKNFLHHECFQEGEIGGYCKKNWQIDETLKMHLDPFIISHSYLRTFAPKNFPRTEFFKTLTVGRKW